MKTIAEKIKAKKDTKWLNETKESREITKEILKYGVSQSQIKTIIKLLALELEDVPTMKAISEILSESVNEPLDTVNILQPGGKTNE